MSTRSLRHLYIYRIHTLIARMRTGRGSMSFPGEILDFIIHIHRIHYHTCVLTMFTVFVAAAHTPRAKRVPRAPRAKQVLAEAREKREIAYQRRRHASKTPEQRAERLRKKKEYENLEILYQQYKKLQRHSLEKLSHEVQVRVRNDLKEILEEKRLCSICMEYPKSVALVKAHFLF